ncbi:MAG: hypothetical protein EPO64_11275 [Nitrospirae bacterium]|nr:MAG: hypothetical protein EPO64_11275 [Nitrospirota bacterium]
MRRRTITVIAIVTLMLIGGLPWTSDVHAQVLADYTASPPFTTAAVPPNILLLLDNSGSMNRMAYTAAFDPTYTYSGIFDSTQCYTYGSNVFQPNPSPSTKPCSASYPWDGNLLNYVSMREIDIVKVVMLGGQCTAGGRSAQGTCTRLAGQSTFSNAACCADQTQSITAAQAAGLMPSSLIPGSGNVYFHSMGSISTLKGSFCVSSSSTQPSGNSTCPSQWQIQANVPVNPTGIIQQVGSKARFGLMEFNSGANNTTTTDGGVVLNNVGGTVTSMVTAIENTTPSAWTPLAESLYEATRYFAQVPPAFAGSDYTYNVTNQDPYYFLKPGWTDTSQYVNCCKSFVLIFTDGQPTQDKDIPASLQDYAHTAANHGTSDHCAGASGCTGTLSSHSNTSSTFHNSLTDHHDNCSAYFGGATSDSCVANGSHYLDDVAYFAHITDLRQATVPVLGTGQDLPGMQNLTVYAFFAFGTGGNLLKDAAKVGGFTDLNGNNLPDLQQEWDQVNNQTGARGSDGIPDNYFEATDASKLQERLMAAITSILQRSASGTSVSVLATSSTGDGSLYQAYFFPLQYEGLNSVAWTGYTQGLFIDEFGNVREDTDGDGKLIYQNDIIIRTRYDSNSGNVLVDRFVDSDGDGKSNGPATPATVGLKEIKPIWEAGRRLALTSPSARTILTWVDINNNGIVDAGEQIPFTTANSATLAPYLRAGAAPYTADNIVNFVRGSQVTGLRDRQLTVTDDAGASALQVWKMGDPINATPTVVGAPKERFDVIYGDASYTAFFQQYKSRRQVAYVGANDGMLHAFNGGFYHKGDDPNTPGATEHGYFTRTAADNSGGALLGQELWGFIPYQLLPHLQWLTQSGYTHVYYVDLKPKVTDVRIFTPDADHPNGWGTILIGGMRMGGSCGACVSSTGAPPMTVTADFGSGVQTRTFYTAYFVLDITNPDKSPVLLWSFTDSTLGLSTSYPAVLRVKPACSTPGCKTDNSDAKWFMLVGSGPTGYGGSSSQTGKIFVVDLAAGPKDPATGASLVSSFPTSDPNSFMGDAVALDADLDFRVDAAYLGNVINNGNNPSWAGKLYRLTTGGTFPFGVTVGPSAWGIVSGANRAPTVLLATFPTGGTTLVGPISAAPTVTADDANRLWVFFGTGRFYSTSDKTNTDTQYFFGVKDPVVTGGCAQSSVTSCQKNNLLNVSAVTVCTTCAAGTNQVSGIAGVTTFSGTATTTLEGMVQSMDGWYTTLPTSGERSLSPPVILGGTVFFTTFTPSSDICSSGGTGNVYALFYKTGSANKEPVIGTYTGTGGGVSNAACAGASTCVSRAMGLGAGLPSQMAVQIGAQGTGSFGSASGSGCTGRTTLISQASTGAMNQLCSKPALSSWSRYVSWINQRD